MRLLFAADLHYALRQFDWLVSQAGSYDLVVLGGDCLDLSSDLDADVQIAVVEKYFTLLRNKSQLAVCSGNHDGDSRNEADESVAEWLEHARSERVYVDGDSFSMGDTRITLCPWWDGEVSRGQVESQLAAERASVSGKWVWIHHAPPEGSKTSWTGKKFVGDEYLRKWIERFAPDLVLSGHIHNSPFYGDGSWIDRIGKTWVFNPGKQIGPEPCWIAVDLDAMTAEWKSLEGTSVHDLRIAQG